MPSVTIDKHREVTERVLELFEEIERLQAEVRQKAQQVAEQRASRPWSDFDNWLVAEKEVLHLPACELYEDERRYLLRAALPGWKPEQIRVTLLPRALVLEAEARQGAAAQGAQALFSEFGQARVLRRFDFPVEIDADKAKAQLQGGILEVTAPKLGSAEASKRKAKPKDAKAKRPKKETRTANTNAKAKRAKRKK